MTTIGVQVTLESTCGTAVAPRNRAKRARGATEEKNPAALAAGNGRNTTTAAAGIEAASEALAVEPRPARRVRRRYHRVVVGGEMEVSDGFVRRWVDIEDEWGRPQRVRLTDADGFPISEWVETERFLSDSRTIVRFPVDEFLEPPSVVWFGRNGQVHYGPPKGTKPSVPPARTEWFRPVPKDYPDREAREAFEARRAEWLAGLRPGPIDEEVAKPVPAAPEIEKWFFITLPPVAMQNPYWGVGHEWDGYIPPDARQNFPDGWPCRIVDPQPDGYWTEWNGWVEDVYVPSRRVAYDPNWTYVQFPVHYWVLDVEGQWQRLTDKAGRGKGEGDHRVNCGMWVPRWLLKPVTPTEARSVYDWLLAEYRQALKAAGW